MNAFNLVESYGGPKYPEYVYVPHERDEAVLRAGRRVRAGRPMFQSHLDESFVSHQYIIAAQAASAVNLPGGVWGCDGGPSDTVTTLNKNRTYGAPVEACFDYTTLGDELDNANLTWRFYTSTIDNDGGEWSGYQAVDHIRYGPDWAKDVITPQTQFFTDLSNGESGQRHLDHAHLRDLRSRELRRRPGPHRGCRRWSTRSARASSGIRPPSS
jgi:hypothetical protein